MKSKSDEFLWVEKYRPTTIDECILPTKIKRTFSEIIKSGELPNMMFVGTAGVGKTTVARALCNELNVDYIIINCSEDGNIDTLRGKIRRFASSVSLMGGFKVVILDEADYLNAQSTQPALRGFIEEFSNNCRFIFTANFRNRIIDPIHSRCSVYEFAIPNNEKQAMAVQFFNRCSEVLKAEGVEFEPHALAQLVERFFPDWRRVLNELQRHGISGSIDAGVSGGLADSRFDGLVTALKEKDFKEMRRWVVENIDQEATSIFRKIYDSMYEILQPQSIPQVVLILAQYQYYDAFVADHELNIVAAMTEIMVNAEWK